ncbi:MAG: hypothetical protein LBH26_06985, partial [Treponema sp.]|nr:hypothetical protein [Treponema sp.]
SVHNVDTLWTDFLEKRIFAAFRRENARSVRKVTDFADRHYIMLQANQGNSITKTGEKPAFRLLFEMRRFGRRPALR